MRSQPGALTPARGVQRQRGKPEEGNQSQWARGALQSHVLDQVSWREEPDANHHPSRVRELFLEPWLCAEHLHTSSHRIITATFWRVKVKVKSLSRVRLFVTPWTVAHQAPPSMEFSRQDYWSGLPFPSPADLPNPGIKPGSPAWQADALLSEPSGRQ